MSKHRFKFHAADISRMDREYKETGQVFVSIKGDKPKHVKPKKDLGATYAEVREAMRCPKYVHSKRDARNGVTVKLLLGAAPWREESE